MALTIQIDPDTEKRLADEAAARGLTPEDVAREAIDAWTAHAYDDWDEDDRRLEEPGESIPLDVAIERFRSAIAIERAKQK